MTTVLNLINQDVDMAEAAALKLGQVPQEAGPDAERRKEEWWLL